MNKFFDAYSGALCGLFGGAFIGALIAVPRFGEWSALLTSGMVLGCAAVAGLLGHAVARRRALHEWGDEMSDLTCGCDLGDD